MHDKKDITAVIITTIISLLTLLTMAGTFISKQTTLEVELINIKKELTNISIKLDKRDDEINTKLSKRDDEIKILTEKVIKIEQKINP